MMEQSLFLGRIENPIQLQSCLGKKYQVFTMFTMFPHPFHPFFSPPNTPNCDATSATTGPVVPPHRSWPLTNKVPPGDWSPAPASAWKIPRLLEIDPKVSTHAFGVAVIVPDRINGKSFVGDVLASKMVCEKCHFNEFNINKTNSCFLPHPYIVPRASQGVPLIRIVSEPKLLASSKMDGMTLESFIT